ncbi:LuxR C-terminal-related transcriptional regulator (plasmid) [Enterobacter kobei]|nr:LuxR C-terminal-related transcriptional regulator [Enterobacter kobei]
MGPNVFCSRLTARERFILKESLKGLTVKQIASINSIPEKSVYAQRLTACRKLGFTSHRAIWELPLSTLQWQI